MSLLIKGMDLPKTCKDCLCREYPKFSFESDWCCLNQKTISDVKVISPNCPLIKIPTPHGRLIDANRLLKVLSKNSIISKITYADGDSIEDIIRKTPTIIEAEVDND